MHNKSFLIQSQNRCCLINKILLIVRKLIKEMVRKMKTQKVTSKSSLGLLLIVFGLWITILNVSKNYSKEEFRPEVFIAGLVFFLIYYSALIWSVMNYQSKYGKFFFYNLSILFFGLLLLTTFRFSQSINFDLLIWCSKLSYFSLPLFGGVTFFFMQPKT